MLKVRERNNVGNEEVKLSSRMSKNLTQKLLEVYPSSKMSKNLIQKLLELTVTSSRL